MSPVRRPVDQAVRDAIRDELDVTMFVEAGAGTGKTAALVSRVVALVASGTVALRNLAAITFTEAAASELRDRIRLELERAAAGQTDPSLEQPARARCASALHELDDAALTTLHGFAQRVLAQHPFEAGLPPRFEVVDEVEAQIAFDQRWSDFLDRLFDDPSAESVLLAAFALGLRLDGLRRIARAMHDHVDRVAAAAVPLAALPPVDVGPILTPLRAALVLGHHCTSGEDRLAAHLARLEHDADELAAAPDELERLDLLGAFPQIAGRVGNKSNWSCDIEEVRGHLRDAQAARDDQVARTSRAALRFLLSRMREFVLEYAEDRRREGRLEFHDLLVLARHVLASDHTVRDALRRRFHVLLIDEFQDTDPLQIELAVLLTTTDPQAGDRPWHEADVEPGRLFVVGDPKQSIYRFRRADLALYHRVEERLRPGHRRLDENFRSAPDVLAWVNDVFARLLPADEPGVQAGHVPLRAHRAPVPGAAPAVQVFGAPSDAARVGEVREREAAEVAELVRRVKHEKWPVVDPVDEQVRTARYADVALLLPTRTALPEIERALERADVPVRIESQSLVYSTAEVRDLLSILTALDDPTDEVALVASLRTPALGCGDDDLVRYRLAGGRWDYRRTAPDELPEGDPVAVGMSALRALHDRRWWATVAETVAMVVRERRMLELAVAHPRPRDHWRRLRFLLDRARAYDEAGGTGLRGFVEWVKQQSDERARAVEVVVPERDDDAVRILTVHGAKGLEFPIVVLAGLNAAPQWRMPPVLWTTAGGMEAAVGPKSARVATGGYDEQEEVDKRLDAAERLRLLYVACTRARDHLLVSLHHKAGDRSPAAQLWEPACGAPGAAITVDAGAARPAAPDAAGGKSARAGDGLAARDAWLADRRVLVQRAGRPATVAATTLAGAAQVVPDPGLEKPDPGLEKEDTTDEALPPWRRGRAGTAIGRAVHAVLQTIDLATGEGLDATARAQALAEGIPDREAEVRALARSVLDAPVVREAVQGGRAWREVPVAAAVGAVTVEGFIDLLVDGPEGLIVVDYKTDAVATDDIDERMAKYRLQGAAYALALERALGRAVSRCVFVFARAPGGAVERDVDDLAGAVHEVEARVDSLASPVP